MQYKNTDKSLKEIGKELGVGSILEGSVRRSGDRVRISGQLIDARGDKHLWAETYDRDLKDIFEVQSDVATQIAVALKAELTPGEKERIEKTPTGDLRAYDYYLKGREYALRYTKEDNERALDLYQRALSTDPNYALAYAGIAISYSQGVFRFGSASAWLDSAITAAEEALSIEPDLAEAHMALGSAYWGKGWLAKALESYRRALEINPNYAAAASNIGTVHGILGDFAEQFRWYKKTMALMPTAYVTPVNMAASYLDLGDYANAERCYRRALEIVPDYRAAEFGLSYAYLYQGNGRKALEQVQQGLSKYPDDVDGLWTGGRIALFLGLDARAKAYFEKLAELTPGSRQGRYANIRLGYLLWKAGKKDEARKKLEASLASLKDELGQGSKRPRVPYAIATIHAVQGENREACEWLQKAVDAGYMEEPWPSMDPLFEDLRDDACLKEIMAQIQAKADKIRKEIEELE